MYHAEANAEWNFGSHDDSSATRRCGINDHNMGYSVPASRGAMGPPALNLDNDPFNNNDQQQWPMATPAQEAHDVQHSHRDQFNPWYCNDSTTRRRPSSAWSSGSDYGLWGQSVDYSTPRSSISSSGDPFGIDQLIPSKAGAYNQFELSGTMKDVSMLSKTYESSWASIPRPSFQRPKIGGVSNAPPAARPQNEDLKPNTSNSEKTEKKLPKKARVKPYNRDDADKQQLRTADNKFLLQLSDLNPATAPPDIKFGKPESSDDYLAVRLNQARLAPPGGQTIRVGRPRKNEIVVHICNRCLQTATDIEQVVMSERIHDIAKHLAGSKHSDPKLCCKEYGCPCRQGNSVQPPPDVDAKEWYSDLVASYTGHMSHTEDARRRHVERERKWANMEPTPGHLLKRRETAPRIMWGNVTESKTANANKGV